MSLLQKTARGSAWTFVSSLAQAFLTLASSVVITRLVTPVDLGRYALVTTIVYILTTGASVYSGGYYVVTKTPSRRLLRTALAFELGAGLAAWILVAAGTVVYALLSHDTRFALLLALAGVLVITNAFGSPNGPLASVYTRNLEYRLPTIAWLLCFLGSVGLKIGLVAVGFGAWGLVLGDVFLSIAFGGAMFVLVRPGLRPQIDRADLRELVAWAKPSVVGNFAWTFGEKIADLSVAAILGTRPLGLYYLASRLPNQLLQLGVNLSGAFLPAFSRSDDEQLARGYTIATRLKAFFILLPLAITIPLSHQFIRVVYGPIWDGAAIPFALLMGALSIRSIFHHQGNLLKARGRVRELAVLGMARLAITAGGVLAGAFLFGLKGAAAGILVAEGVLIPWRLGLVRSIVPFSIGETFRRPVSAFLLSTAFAAVVARVLPAVPALIAATGVALAIFAAFAWHGDAPVFRELAASFRRRNRRGLTRPGPVSGDPV